MGARGTLIAAGIGFLMLAGGAALLTGVVHLPVTCEGPPAPAWGDNPYGNGGIQVADLTEAYTYLAFRPIVPKALGPPAKFFVSANKPDLSARSLTWWYDNPTYGRFAVNESNREVTQAWIDSLNKNPTGCSLDSVVTIEGGTRAALSLPNPAAHGSGAGKTSIMWLDRGLLISALGFSDRFTKSSAIAVANQF